MAFVQVNPGALGTSIGLIFQLPAGLPLTVVTVGNNTAAAVIFVGGASVGSSGSTQGVQIAAKASVSLTLNAGDKLYAISTTSLVARDISVIYSGI